jgi:high-affinity K+ transport system ATPase subunit B
VAGAGLLAVLSLPVQPQSIGSGASITLKSGPHKGKYDFAPTQACVLATFSDKKPLGLSVVMQSKDSSLSIDVPNLDEKHASEVQIVLVVAETRQGVAGRSSVTYEIDTRPDAVLRPVQKAERANKGMTGKATTTLMTQGDNVLVSFTGETMSGVKVEGEVTCRRVK